MLIARSIALFLVAALFEIGGAWLVWQGVREHKGWLWIGVGVIALGGPRDPVRRLMAGALARKP